MGGHISPGGFGYDCVYYSSHIYLLLKMKKSPKESNSSWAVRIMVFFCIVALIFISIAIYRETRKKYQVQKQVDDLRAEARRIEKENIGLADRLEYLSSTDFTEKEAKDKFNLQKPSEKEIIIKPNITKEADPSKESGAGEKKLVVTNSNIQKWWKYLFKPQKL
jgi:cell division protein FtsL